METLGIIAAILATIIALVALLIDLSVRVVAYLQKQQQNSMDLLLELEEIKATGVDRDNAIAKIVSRLKDVESVIKNLGLLNRRGNDE